MENWQEPRIRLRFFLYGSKKQKGSLRRELARKRLRERACTKRFDGSAVKRSKTLFSQSPPPLRGAPSQREPSEKSLPRIPLLPKSATYISLLLWEKVPRNEADEECVKGRCAMEKFVYVTNTSSTASGPPSPAGEGSRKSRFLAIDGGAFCDRYDIGSSRAPTPTGIERNRCF